MSNIFGHHLQSKLYLVIVLRQLNLSVIIPTYHEEDYISDCLASVRQAADQNIEVIVVDASDNDRTLAQINPSHQTKVLKSDKAQRAHQLNLGAQVAKADVLFFLHADNCLPQHFDGAILEAIHQKKQFGQFTVQYDDGPPILRLQEIGSKYLTPLSGGGDQGLWITKSLFNTLNGFDEQYDCMEDFELFNRARKSTSATILPQRIISSARKYNQNSYFKIQAYNLLMLGCFYTHRSPKTINRLQRNFL